MCALLQPRERALADEASRLRHIEARIAQLEAGSEGDLDDVLIRAEPARTIVAVRDTVGSFVEARMIIGELARTLPKRVPRESLGAIIGIAHSAEFEPDAIDVELGFVLNGELPGDLPSIGQRQLQVRDLPAVRLAGPGREVFLRPPRADRMDESVVEMQFPVAREQGGSLVASLRM